ncbi:tumor necrosis factor receptor superfamily member 14-like isoform X2 [Cheilinus undulatus]|uniref:tumor necrosis factor receptor superfamily member 14-like isoform X2 n=1 Tax=Cheilinus undulatus TaxID=241271 RepID=UPI001BD1CF53|nr:tumor necrosis factor receptor superfamily member 14-like isoform X2 [Cheilinus undulatus]
MNPEILLSKMSLKPGSAVTVVILLMIVSSAQTLTCGSTEFWINNRCCPLCPPGSHVDEVCTDSTSTSCSSCTEGTFMDHHTNLPWCYDCSTCDTGSGLKIKTPCRRNSNTVCEPLEGFYCIKFAGGSCWEAQKHRSCEPGEYIRERGTSTSDTLCSPCSAGTFSDGTFTSCRPHRRCESEKWDLLRPGTDSEDAECGGLQSDRTVPIVVVFGGAVVGVGVAAIGAVFLCTAVADVMICITKKIQMIPDSGADIEPMNVSQGVASNGDEPPDMATEDSAV